MSACYRKLLESILLYWINNLGPAFSPSLRVLVVASFGDQPSKTENTLHSIHYY